MKRTTVIALSLGGAVTVLTVAADLLGAFRAIERQSIDLRYAVAPRERRPMTPEIVHVDIDDGSIDRWGRWPWDRSLLADALDELNRAGASTIALDLLLDSEDVRPESDRRFAEAIARGRTVLAVEAGGRGRDRASTFSADEQRLLGVLAQDIQADETTVLDAARITGPLRGRYLARPLEYKRAAAWRVLRGLESLPTLEEFERLIAPHGSTSYDSYPEQRLLREMWMRAVAWNSARSMLTPADAPGYYRDEIALPAFVQGAASIGAVNVQADQHADGVVREISVRQPAPGGMALQFGIAAAALHRGLAVSDVQVTGDRVVFGDVSLPLDDGRIWLNWPTSETKMRWQGLLRQSTTADVTAGHIPIGFAVSIAEMRRKHRGNGERCPPLAAAILQRAELAEGELAADDITAVDDDVAWALPDYEQAAPEELDESARERLRLMRSWRLLREAIDEGEREIAREELRLRQAVGGKLVFVGWTSTGAIADFVVTAMGPRTPGVVVHAGVADMMLTGSAARFPPAWLAPLLVLLLGGACTLSAARFSTVPSAVLAGGALTAYAVVGGLLYSNYGVILVMVAPLVGGTAAWVVCTAFQAAVSQRERARITQQFRARVSAQLVDHLVNNPEAVTVTGEEREMTVLFGDLAGFTTISERLGGATTVSTLNRYMSELTEVLVARGAYLNKFLGDGLMAFWSAFAVDPDQARKACQAALNCQNAVAVLNDDPAYEHIPRLGLRLGIATGEVVVGDCGAPPALNDYTVIGDAVNLAARLESANKQFGTRILINGRTRELLGDAEILLRRLGPVVVVGQTVPVEIYEVLPPETPVDLVELADHAAEAFAQRRREEARQRIDEMERRFGPSRIYTLYRRAMDDEQYDGVLRLEAK